MFRLCPSESRRTLCHGSFLATVFETTAMAPSYHRLLLRPVKIKKPRSSSKNYTREATERRSSCTDFSEMRAVAKAILMLTRNKKDLFCGLKEKDMSRTVNRRRADNVPAPLNRADLCQIGSSPLQNSSPRTALDEWGGK